jgi:hypothetical protein
MALGGSCKDNMGSPDFLEVRILKELREGVFVSAESKGDSDRYPVASDQRKARIVQNAASMEAWEAVGASLGASLGVFLNTEDAEGAEKRHE